jgi:hypothetical protein
MEDVAGTARSHGRSTAERRPENCHPDLGGQQDYLECTVRLLLDRVLCFKHEGMLIFPSEFKQFEAVERERAARTVTIYTNSLARLTTSGPRW